MLLLIHFSIARKTTNSEWFHPYSVSASLQKTCTVYSNAALKKMFVVQALKAVIFNQFNRSPVYFVVVTIQALPLLL